MSISDVWAGVVMGLFVVAIVLTVRQYLILGALVHVVNAESTLATVQHDVVSNQNRIIRALGSLNVDVRKFSENVVTNEEIDLWGKAK
jgi:hypothetical protein